MPESPTGEAEELKARRKHAAEVLAPGRENGIGAPAAKGDDMVETVMEARTTTCVEAEEPPATAPIEQGASVAT